MKIPKIRRELMPGEAAPKWYGVAYLELNRAVAVIYPIPLNLIVAAGYYTMQWVRIGAAVSMGMYLRRKRISGTYTIAGFEQHDLFAFLTPYIERAGYTWKLTPAKGTQNEVSIITIV